MAKKITVAKKAVKGAKRAKAPKVPKPAAKPATSERGKQPKRPRAVKPGNDTGSAAAQIRFFSDRIEELVNHLRSHPKDFDSKRGLLMLIGKRRRMLNYLARSNPTGYEKLAAALKLAKAKS